MTLARTMMTIPNSEPSPGPRAHHDDHEEDVERGDEVGDGEEHLVGARARARARARVRVRVRVRLRVRVRVRLRVRVRVTRATVMPTKDFSRSV